MNYNRFIFYGSALCVVLCCVFGTYALSNPAANSYFCSRVSIVAGGIALLLFALKTWKSHQYLGAEGVFYILWFLALYIIFDCVNTAKSGIVYNVNNLITSSSNGATICGFLLIFIEFMFETWPIHEKLCVD